MKTTTGIVVNYTDSMDRLADNTKHCWECIVCRRIQISEYKPAECAFCLNSGWHNDMVLNTNLIVTK